MHISVTGDTIHHLVTHSWNLKVVWVHLCPIDCQVVTSMSLYITVTYYVLTIPGDLSLLPSPASWWHLFPIYHSLPFFEILKPKHRFPWCLSSYCEVAQWGTASGREGVIYFFVFVLFLIKHQSSLLLASLIMHTHFCR